MARNIFEDEIPAPKVFSTSDKSVKISLFICHILFVTIFQKRKSSETLSSRSVARDPNEDEPPAPKVFLTIDIVSKNFIHMSHISYSLISETDIVGRQ